MIYMIFGCLDKLLVPNEPIAVIDIFILHFFVGLADFGQIIMTYSPV